MIRPTRAAERKITAAQWTIDDCITSFLLLLFFTHFYIPILEPVQNTLFAATQEDKTALGQCITIGVWSIAAALMLRHSRCLLSGFRSIAWIVAFAVFALVSALWSQDPSVTARKAAFLLLTTAFGIYFARRYTIEQQLKIICGSACIITLLSILFATLLPRYGLDHDAHEGVWVGVFTQKNVCAREMLFILACLLAYAPATSSMRWIRRITICGALIVIVGTQSKTAAIMTLLVLLGFPLLRLVRLAGTSLAFATFACLSAGLAMGVIVAASALPGLVLAVGGDATITGRTEIWHAVLEAILKRPFLGYGFAAFWLSLRGESANIVLALRWAVPAAHNGFLEIWLQLGAVGLLLFVMGFIRASITAVHQVRQPSFMQAAWPASILLLTLAYNLDESSLMQPNDFIWVLYVANAVNLAASCRQAPRLANHIALGPASRVPVIRVA